MAGSIFDTLKTILFGTPVRDNASAEHEAESLLHIGWQQREESFYPSLFGRPDAAPVCLTEDIFKQDFDRNSVHPFWLHHSIMTFPPTETRQSWLYATSGLSNAFDSAVDEWSGLGVEFILETPLREAWAADKLARLMAYNLLIAAGHYKDQSDLSVGSIVRLGVPVNGEDNCALTNFIALEPASATRDFSLVTGKVELLQMVAITDAEADLAEREGRQILAEKLAEAGHQGPIDTGRPSVV